MPDYKGRKRGNPDSSWLVARRCLAVINRLQQGPASKQTLIAAVYQASDPEADPQTLANRFDKDKERLRNKLEMSIYYDKEVKGYVLGKWERPLLSHSGGRQNHLRAGCGHGSAEKRPLRSVSSVRYK